MTTAALSLRSYGWAGKFNFIVANRAKVALSFSEDGPARKTVFRAYIDRGCFRSWRGPMTRTFKVGDHVSWNSEAGRVRGKIIRVHTKDVNYKGYVHHASPDDPQYEIKSDKSDHVALHKGRALRHLAR